MNVVVTGGATIAPIDDVRLLTNVSSGRFAASITEACLLRQARVWHIHSRHAELPILRLARFDLDVTEPPEELYRLAKLREALAARARPAQACSLDDRQRRRLRQDLETGPRVAADRRRDPAHGRV